MLILLLLTISIIEILRRADRLGERQVSATYDWCDAGDKLDLWRDENPGVYIGLSTEARLLVSRLINTYQELLRTHSFMEPDLAYLQHLENLFDDLPPKTPAAAPRRKQKNAPTGRSTLSKTLIQILLPVQPMLLPSTTRPRRFAQGKQII